MLHVFCLDVVVDAATATEGGRTVEKGRMEGGKEGRRKEENKEDQEKEEGEMEDGRSEDRRSGWTDGERMRMGWRQHGRVK